MSICTSFSLRDTDLSLLNWGPTPYVKQSGVGRCIKRTADPPLTPTTVNIGIFVCMFFVIEQSMHIFLYFFKKIARA